MRKIKILYVLLIITNILNVSFLILTAVSHNDNLYDYYWFTAPVLLMLVVAIINEWSKEGLNSDINKSKVIIRGFSDTISTIVIIFGFIFLTFMFLNSIKDGIINNIYVMSGFTIITAVVEIFTYCSIYSTMKETIELLKKQHNIIK